MPVDFEIKIMLDSGAFSAWRLGTTIDLKQYIAYIKRNKKWIDTYVSLDVIPGANMRIDRSPEAVEASATQSYRNHQVMKDAGLSPIPVFHQGERFEHLERYLKDGEPYIGISPYSRAHRMDMVRWMDECFTMCTDTKGNPVCKTHGFGVTAPLIVNRYPWWSVDSISWALTGGYGLCMVPTIYTRRGKIIRTDFVDVRRIHISSRSDIYDRRKPLEVLEGDDTMVDPKSPPTAFDKAGEVTREHIMRILEGYEKSVGEVRNTSFARTVLNVNFFKGLEAQCQHHAFQHRTQPLFGALKTNRKSKGTLPLKIIFAAKAQVFVRNMLLNNMKIGNRLYSYHELRQFPDEAIELLVTEGLPGIRTQARATGNKGNRWGERYRIFRVSKLAERLGERPWDQGLAEEGGFRE